MHLLSSLLLALSANIDNLTVGVSYGIRKIRIGIISNLLIALITSVGTLISMSIGLLIESFLSVKLSNIIGSLILIAIGIWTIKDYIYKPKIKQSSNEKAVDHYNQLLAEPERADIDKSGFIDIKEAVTLGFALTINNFGLGIGASITGLDIWVTIVLIFVFSFVSLLAGYILGKYCLSNILGKYAALLSGLIIIILGIYELII